MLSPSATNVLTPPRSSSSLSLSARRPLAFTTHLPDHHEVHRNDFYAIVLSGSTMLIDNKAPEIVNNDDKDDDDDDDNDRDGDDDELIDEVKNVNNDNSDGATIQRRRIRKREGAGGPASNATHHGEQAVYSQVGS